MTVCLPLEASSPCPQSPSFLVPSSDRRTQLAKVIKAIMKAKRITVVCGAGISVQAGIPDFRSSDGLFQSLKRDNPKESLTSGRDLFDASVFNSENTTTLFCQMIVTLSELSNAASPTPFHNLMRTLDNRGRLLRVYTQNIDALESKSGLSFGVPQFEDRGFNAWSPKSKGKSKASQEPPSPIRTHSASTRLPSPPAETPRCIPLHGTIHRMHCQICMHSFPLEDHLLSLSSGLPPACPECTLMETARQLVGKRSRRVGKLRPSVVLYNEDHREGEGVGDVVRKDLVGGSKGKGKAGADLLLVVGTSLRVPGTKRIVREFSKAVRSRSSSSKDVLSGLLTPSSTPPRRASPLDEEPPVKSIYLNLDFPVPTREWEGVFDVWLKGDAQLFAEMLKDEIEKEDRSREAAVDRRKRREDEAARREMEDAGRARKATSEKKRKRKDVPETPTKPRKKLKSSTPSSVKTSGARARSGVTIKKPFSSSTNGTKGSAGAHAPFVIKIPPRPAKPLLIPEVYITTSPPKFGKKSHPPSPSPPSRRKPSASKVTTKAIKAAPSSRGKQNKLTKAKTPTTSPRPTENRPDEWGDVHDEDIQVGDSDTLTDAFVRTIQYGLRGKGG